MIDHTNCAHPRTRDGRGGCRAGMGNPIDDPDALALVEARHLDDEIEDARAEELLAERRTEARDALAGLTREGRDAVRALIVMARWVDDAIRTDAEFDEDADPFALIDEAGAYASDPTPSGLAPGVRHDLGTDFRGLTATAGSLATALGALDPDAQVWVQVAQDGSDVPHAIDAVHVQHDGTVRLLGPGVRL